MPIQTQFPISLFKLSGGNAPIVYLLHDEFTTDEAAPLTSPRTCEPGPGAFQIIDPAGTNIKITNGVLSLTGRNSWDDTGFSATEPIERVPGLVYATRYIRYGSASIPMLLAPTSTLTRNGSGWTLGNSISAKVKVYDIMGTLTQGRFYDLFTILRDTGAYYVFTDDMGRWLLGYVEKADTTNPVYPQASIFHNQEQRLDNLSVFQIPEWNDADIYSIRVAVPSSGETIATEANALVEFTWTPAAGETLNLQVRRVNDDNCWIVRGDQVGGTVKLIKKAAGVETELASAAQTWTVGATYRVHVVALNAAICVSINSTNRIDYTTATFQQVATGAKVTGFTTGSDFIAWPMEIDKKRPALLTTLRRHVGMRANHTRLADLPVRVDQATLESLDGKIYLVGGESLQFEGNHSKKAYAYDPQTDAWTEIADLPIACQSAVLRAVGGKLYHIGGYYSTTQTFYNHVYEYDPDLNTWTRKTDMPTPREDMGSAVIEGKIHVFGGNYPYHAPNTVHEVYDPTTDTWETKTPLPEAKWSGDFGAALNGKAYAVGASNTFADYPSAVHPAKSVYEYDPDTNIWTQKADLPLATQYREVETLNGKIYVVAGVTDSMHHAVDDIYAFDPAANFWQLVGHAPYQVHGPSLAALGGYIYMAGGDVYLVGQFNCFYRLRLV